MSPRPLGPSAFTLVELIVVITVIVLILAIAIPGMSRMHDEMRMSAAQQTMQGVTTRAYLLSLADRSMTAVRFFPGEWDTVDTAEKQAPGGRQHMAVYSYVGTTVNPDTLNVELHEYFQRAKDLGSVRMPEGVWAAPLEALSPLPATLGGTQYYLLGADFVLDGQVGQFDFNADRAASTESKKLLNADDFLLVFDPETGLRVGTPAAYHLRTYVPKYSNGNWGYDADTLNSAMPNDTTLWYQRYGFSGVVTYPREAFAGLPGGATAYGTVRQPLLKSTGRPYLVHRFSGGLLPGATPAK